MLINIKKILEDMGWAEGLRIPVANSENLKLQTEIERLTLAKAKATLNLEAISSKCSALDKHLKNVKSEQEQNQQLILARLSELKDEKDLCLLTKMEKEQITSEAKSFTKEFEKVEARKQSKLKDLNNLVQKLDKMKTSMEWDEQVIDEWDKLLLKNEEDNSIIKKFSDEDKKKAKDLEIKRLRLQEEEISRKQLVIKTSKELDSLELILNRNVQLYKQLHEERSALVKQWQEAVKTLQQRDKDTLMVNREIIYTKELIETKLESLEQEKKFYNNEVNNNAEMEIQNTQANSEVAKLRKDLANYYRNFQDTNIEFETTKRDLKRSADLLETERGAIKDLQSNILQKEKYLKNSMIKVQQLKVQEKNVQESKLTADERVRALEDLIQSEEVIHKGLVVDLENIENVIYRSQKTLNDLVEFHKLKTLECQAHEQEILLIEKQKQQIDKELLYQKEQHYKCNFKMAMLLSKLTRMTGEDVQDDEGFDSKLKELEVKCKEVIDATNMLQTQINRLENVMRNLTNLITTDSEKIANIKDKLQYQLLQVEGGEKILRTKKNLYHQHQVEENILKVKLKCAEKNLKSEGNSVYNLKRQQIELEIMARERESEIGVNKDLLLVKRIALQEDNGRLKLDIQGRRLKIETLKKRLDGILMTLGKSEDGETLSVAYFKVKNAQEKFLLQEEGDKLDNLIRKAEKEIIAMENTLKAVNVCNDTYRKSLTLIEEQDDEIAEMKEIENKIHNEIKILHQYKTKFEKQQQKLQEIKEILNNKKEEVEELEKQISEKEFEQNQLQNEAFHRNNKMERVDKHIKKLITGKEIDGAQKLDFIIRHLQDFNRNALQQLVEAGIKYLETNPIIKRYLSECNFTMSKNNSNRSSTQSYSSRSFSTTPSNCSMHSITLSLNIQK